MIAGTVLIAIAVKCVLLIAYRIRSSSIANDDQSIMGYGPTLAVGRLTDSMAKAIPITPNGRKRLRSELVQAGYYYDRVMLNFLATRNLALMAWCMTWGALLAFEIIEQPSVKLLGIVVAGAALIYGLPRIVLSSKARSRSMSIQNDLPDALDMMTMMMAGGLTMQQSLQRVIGEFEATHPDLSTELAIVARQSEAGCFNDALISFAERLALPDVTTLVTLMRQSNRLGGKIVDALREYADSMRRIRSQKAEEQGNRASIKLLLPVIFCLAPPIYILLLGPAVLELKDFVSRENQPGGVLNPTVEAQDANLAQQIPPTRPTRR